MRLKDGSSVILFRYHRDPDIARERVLLLRRYNPSVKIYALFGGEPSHFDKMKAPIEDLVENVWLFDSGESALWKWRHGHVIVKQWYRHVGVDIDFDFIYIYEYDLVIFAALVDVYPDIDDQSIVLGACSLFTETFQSEWWWTSPKYANEREFGEYDFTAFSRYMESNFGLSRPSIVCLGPGSLLSKNFLSEWVKTEDITYVHEEIIYPAYAEALGFAVADHGMNSSFGQNEYIKQYFHCYGDKPVTSPMVRAQLSLKSGIRAFHPVKEKLGLPMNILPRPHEAIV